MITKVQLLLTIDNCKNRIDGRIVVDNEDDDDGYANDDYFAMMVMLIFMSR
jgi:hypothetical protein